MRYAFFWKLFSTLSPFPPVYLLRVSHALGHIFLPPAIQLSSFQMESCAMSDHKFEISFWGIKISAQGLGIAAAVVVVGMFLAFSRW
ncbi:hypothetical protein XI08_30095 [Bradyrhizobium sp. CCBAU 11361]|nr:hypothetical protein [Bradyrhizobium sp. CCBAU 11361]